MSIDLKKLRFMQWFKDYEPRTDAEAKICWSFHLRFPDHHCKTDNSVCIYYGLCSFNEEQRLKWIEEHPIDSKIFKRMISRKKKKEQKEIFESRE